MCVEGDCKIHVRSTKEDILLREGSAVLIPAIIADYDVIPLGKKSRLLDTYIDNNGRKVWNKAANFFHITRHNIQMLK